MHETLDEMSSASSIAATHSSALNNRRLVPYTALGCTASIASELAGPHLVTRKGYGKSPHLSQAISFCMPEACQCLVQSESVCEVCSTLVVADLIPSLHVHTCHNSGTQQRFMLNAVLCLGILLTKERRCPRRSVALWPARCTAPLQNWRWALLAMIAVLSLSSGMTT